MFVTFFVNWCNTNFFLLAWIYLPHFHKEPQNKFLRHHPHKIIWSHEKKTYLHANYFFLMHSSRSVFFQMSVLKYYTKLIGKCLPLSALLSKGSAYNPGQNIWQKGNQANLGKTRKIWYLLLRKFRLLKP